MSIKKDIDFELSMSLKDNINLKTALGYTRLIGLTVLLIHLFGHEKREVKNIIRIYLWRDTDYIYLTSLT